MVKVLIPWFWSPRQSDSTPLRPSHHNSGPVGILIAVKWGMKGNFTRSALVLLTSLFLICHSSKIGASPNPLTKKAFKGAISRIVSVKTQQSKDQTAVTISGDGNISEVITKTLQGPPRIIVDIKCAARLLGATPVNVDDPYIKSIRIGYHFNKIRVVMDLKGDAVPAYEDKFKNNILIVTLKFKKNADETNHYRRPKQRPILKNLKK